MTRLVILGAGAMGLATAYEALKQGATDVTVIEADRVPGGMAAHFDFGGTSIERFYHFVCKSDHPTFELMKELGIADKMKWRETKMGFFVNGKLHAWGDPIALLRFPELGLVDKFRNGIMAFLAIRRSNWRGLETITARDWLESYIGHDNYQKLWEPLFRLKFFDLAEDISAAWIWTRIKRVGTSRKSLFSEQLGYVEGGSQTLVTRLVEEIESQGGRLRLSARAARVETENGSVTGVQLADGDVVPADRVISTVPTPFVPDLVPDLPEDWHEKFRSIRNIPVVCVMLKLRRQVTGNFWVNICDPGIEIPGIIEFSNLRPLPDTIVYVPYYMPASHPKWDWVDDQRFIDEAWSYVRKVGAHLGEEDLVDARVGRLKHAQPICEPGFLTKIPPVITPIEGLQIADTCYYYPEDRGIAESVRLGAEMARYAVIEGAPAPNPMPRHLRAGS